MTERPEPNPEQFEAWKKEQGVTPEFEDNVRQGLHNTVEVDLAELEVGASEMLGNKPVTNRNEQTVKTESAPLPDEFKQVMEEFRRVMAEEDALLREYKKLDPSFSIERFQSTTQTNPWRIKYDRTKPSHLASPEELHEKAGIIRGLIEDMVDMNETLKADIVRLKSARQ